MKITRTILTVAAVAYTLMTAARTLHAQYEMLGVITGQVTDWRGNALPAAHVDITDHETGQRTTALMDDAGHYILSGLTPDHHFTLHVRCIGFVPRTEPDVRPVTTASSAQQKTQTLALVPLEKRLAADQRGDK